MMNTVNKLSLAAVIANLTVAGKPLAVEENVRNLSSLQGGEDALDASNLRHLSGSAYEWDPFYPALLDVSKALYPQNTHLQQLQCSDWNSWSTIQDTPIARNNAELLKLHSLAGDMGL